MGGGQKARIGNRRGGLGVEVSSVRMDRAHHMIDPSARKQCTNRPGEDHLPTQDLVLLGDGAAKACALTGGNDDGGDAHGCRLTRTSREGKPRGNGRCCLRPTQGLGKHPGVMKK